ncbi:MAG: hypothetical protein H6839_01685 [Planctomycetes bacterium]|nr:hypothetical protein [Planctomycetota bacterium]
MNPAIVRELFAAHGITAGIKGPWIQVRGFRSKLALLLYKVPAPEGDFVVRLDAVLKITRGQTLLESCVGIGDDLEEATAQALERFSACSLHQLMSAFFGLQGSSQVQRETWQIGRESWIAHLGGLNVVDYREAKSDPVPMAPPEFFPTLESLIKTSTLSKRPHWLRAFRMQLVADEPVVEVMLDNWSWPEAEKLVSDLPWGTTDGIWSVRTFLVITPQGWTGRRRFDWFG